MVNEKLYSATEICEELKISIWTLSNWYTWERKQLADKIVAQRYLPQPVRLNNQKGKPRRWSAEMLEQLRVYQKSIVTGRLGSYGAYSNPYHKETKKYKNSLQSDKDCGTINV